MSRLKNPSISERMPLLVHRTLSVQSQLVPQTKPAAEEPVSLEKHINLVHATGIIIGSVCGTGIFVSPTGVTLNVGSVGMSLILWSFGGIFSMVLALCYAEIGSVMPVAGGDYAYVQRILGPGPSFMCLWAVILLMAAGCALMARTASLYLLQMMGMECRMLPLLLIACWLHCAFAYMNCLTSKWSTKLLTIFSVGKILAMATVILLGLIHLVIEGNADESPAFAGTNWSFGAIATGFVPGFVAFCGWDSVSALAGEMKNPKRDLPIALVSSIVIVTAIYILINVAYFSVLSTKEFISSDAVAMTFAAKVLPKASYLVPIMVAMAASGSVNGVYVMAPRYFYAGGKDQQLPEVFSYLHHTRLTPIPAIIFIFILSMLLTCATFINIQGLIQLLGILIQMKIAMTLVAALRLKWTDPDLERSVRVPAPVMIISLMFLFTIMALAVYEDPLENGLGIVIFLIGIPLCIIGRYSSQQPQCCRWTAHLTAAIQKIVMVVP